MKALSNVSAIFFREIASYFLSPIAYVVTFLFLLVNGVMFYISAINYQDNPQQIDGIIGYLFGSLVTYFWIILLPPIITMRLFAEEKRTGTLETLMTAPVTDAQVVAGKFLAAEVFYMLIWSTLLLHVLMLSILGNPDLGPVKAIYIGLIGLGALMNSLGLLASALTRNQIISASLSLVGCLFLVTLGLLRIFFPDDPEAGRFFDFIGISSHFIQFLRGVVDLRYLGLYLLGTGIFLFLAVRILEGRRWK